METVIELKGIEKDFGEVLAVDNIDLSIRQGEILSLLGPSGCGKTTTLRMIAGLERPTSGELLLHGKNIIDVPIRKRNMTMVFQNYALFPHMTIEENIGFGMTVRHINRAEKKAKVDELLRVVKLEGYGDRYPSQLSGGQQQRVALARALITNPNVLLLDEPFGALDKKLRENMQLEIRTILKKLQTTAVFVTHDQEEALVLSDRIVVMNKGHIEQIATPKEMYEHPKTRFVANFIGVSNTIEGKVNTSSDGRRYIDYHGNKIYFEVDTGDYGILIIRPERVQILDKIELGDNMLTGRVDNIKYLGSTIQYYIETGDGNQIIANMQNVESDSALYPVGTNVGIYLNPSYLVSVEESE